MTVTTAKLQMIKTVGHIERMGMLEIHTDSVGGLKERKHLKDSEVFGSIKSKQNFNTWMV
jgi:hypothetical protein